MPCARWSSMVKGHSMLSTCRSRYLVNTHMVMDYAVTASSLHQSDNWAGYSIAPGQLWHPTHVTQHETLELNIGSNAFKNAASKRGLTVLISWTHRNARIAIPRHALFCSAVAPYQGTPPGDKTRTACNGLDSVHVSHHRKASDTPKL